MWKSWLWRCAIRRVTVFFCLIAFALLGIAQFAIAQTSVLHLHEETDPSTGDYLLKSAPPDAPAQILPWDVTNQTGLVGGPAFVSESPMTVSGNSTLSVTVWAAVTYSTSNVFLSVSLQAINEDTGQMTAFCGWSGYSHSLPLTTTLTAYSFSCTPGVGVDILNSPIYMYTSAYIYPRAVKKTVSAEIAIEGSAFGNYDSYVDLWQAPAITGVTPSSGPPGTSVSITGAYFGSTQGSVTFNGTQGVVSNWSDTSISATPPSGIAPGAVPVVVTSASGVASNSVTFTVTPGPSISSLSPTSGCASSSVTIAGTTFGSSQGSSTVTFNGALAAPTSWSDTSIVVPVPSNASTGPVVVTTSDGASNGVTFTIPGAPTISGTSLSSGSIGTAVTIDGSCFGTSQGGSTVTFNGVSATSTSWSETAINTSVPGNASSGPVLVKVNGVNSNGVLFTVLGAINGTVTDAGNGSAISGASVEALRSNTVLASTTTATDGTYSIPNLSTGSYDIRFSASGYGTKIVPGNFVSSGGSVTANASLSLPGTIAGQVTQADGTTPIAGAMVSAVQGSSSTASTTTDSSGSYSLATLAAGTYNVLAAAAGYQSKSSGGVTVTAGNTTTQDFSLTTENQSSISYLYDELGRLIGASDAQGNTADYAYDSVGNLLSISVNPSSQVSIIGFDPGSGPVGTTVTISGTGFSSTASEDSVTFNGTAATVTSASSTQIVTTVPTGATTGPIVVTTPNGSATSSSSFTVQ